MRGAPAQPFNPAGGGSGSGAPSQSVRLGDGDGSEASNAYGAQMDYQTSDTQRPGTSATSDNAGGEPPRWDGDLGTPATYEPTASTGPAGAGGGASGSLADGSEPRPHGVGPASGDDGLAMGGQRGIPPHFGGAPAGGAPTGPSIGMEQPGTSSVGGGARGVPPSGLPAAMQAPNTMPPGYCPPDPMETVAGRHAMLAFPVAREKSMTNDNLEKSSAFDRLHFDSQIKHDERMARWRNSVFASPSARAEQEETMAKPDLDKTPSEKAAPVDFTAKLMQQWANPRQTPPVAEGHQRESLANSPGMSEHDMGHLAEGHDTARDQVRRGSGEYRFGSPMTHLSNQQLHVQDAATVSTVYPDHGALASSIYNHEAKGVKLQSQDQAAAACSSFLGQLAERRPQGAAGIGQPAPHTAPDHASGSAPLQAPGHQFACEVPGQGAA